MKKTLTLKIVRCGIMGAMLFASQLALSGLPNVETVALLLIAFAVVYGREAYWAAAVFNLCELVCWGFGLWWISYLYVWNILVFLVLLLRNRIKDDPMMWAAFSAVFGLCFGALFALAYIPVSLNTALAYWLAGLSWDIWHGICNFALTAVLYKPLVNTLRRIHKNT